MIIDVKFSENDTSFDPELTEENDSFESRFSDVHTIHGKDGKSAYEIAVENGFVGTEEEWLESLQGDDYVITEEDYEEIAKHIKADVDYLTVVDGMLCMKYTEV